jgi:hypothetical protein
MSTLLQTKCILNVERRDPLPYTPACVLDSGYTDKKSPNSSRLNTPSNSRAAEMAELNQIAINWAAPSRSMTIQKYKKTVNERIPFPSKHIACYSRLTAMLAVTIAHLIHLFVFVFHRISLG